MTITLSRASFAGIAFPFTEITVSGAHRYHVHEYPHSPGGDPEKMGRKLYVIRMSAWFHELSGLAAVNYPDLWPNGLRTLRNILETGSTEDLVVPTIGTIRAFPTAWTQKFVTGQALDGEKVDFEFCEDQDTLNLGGNDFDFAAESMSEAAAKLDLAAALRDYTKERKPGIFEQINDAVGSVTAMKDKVGAINSLVSSKIETVKSLCSQVESVVDFMGSAESVPIAVAVRNLWFAANELAANLVVPATRLLIYVVPSTTTVVDLSQRLYGTTTRAQDLLRLNAFSDAYKIPAGTEVTYAVPA